MTASVFLYIHSAFNKFAYNICLRKAAYFKETLYRSLVSMCSEARMIGELDCSTETLQKQFKQWGTSLEGQRDILRLVHVGLLEDHKADQAAKVMIMLLGTYTEEDAAQAREDAIECVRTAVVDPKSFSFDHLQRLCAVKALKKSDPLMYSALELFISGTLKDYRAFVKAHPEFVGEKLKVDEAVLLKKIRLLTLMTIAEGNNVIQLDNLAEELDLPSNDQLEEFIIDAIQVNAISGKLNEMTRTLVVSSFQHRQFGREQWQTLQVSQVLFTFRDGIHETITTQTNDGQCHWLSYRVRNHRRRRDRKLVCQPGFAGLCVHES
ncbi:hypothetical protein Y032_0244g3513 [Ancylostoma ceylanicum]|uniref:PCI domain-containing protein n=1 Tax=Ancylostoma ceylanicum TaxID=53326 RepID=A0A016SDY8_9BILA|nr:hypothetical protein Y032_0244g3513 [Ancylostoma ceylanicum]